MKKDIPTPEIISNLLTENWQLRWQALEKCSQLQLSVRDYARTSEEYQAVQRLGKQLARTLNGPNDHNLQLVMTAAYFLGGNNFILHIFHQLGIDYSDEFYPGLSKIERELRNNTGKFSFYDYFLTLMRTRTAVESTTAIAATLAINLFPAAKALQLIITIPSPALRSLNLELLRQTHPQHNFNDFIFAGKYTLLQKYPELIQLLVPPLSHEQTRNCNAVTTSQLLQTEELTPALADAIGRLKLNECLPLLEKFADKNLAVTIIKAQLGDRNSCEILLTESNSWRRKKRLSALPGLAFIATSTAANVLWQRAAKGDHNERRLALTALAGNTHPHSLAFLILALKKAKTNSERRFLLTILKHHSQAHPNITTANLLGQWHEQEELYPELLETLAVFGYGDHWEKIVCSYKPPLQRHQQDISLFMARFADHPAINKALPTFLDNCDWSFSFQLLTVLQQFFTGNDFKLLLSLLEKYETGRELTIQEKLTQSGEISDFQAALNDFLNTNKNIADKMIRRFISELTEGSLPPDRELRSDFTKQPHELQKLCLGTENNAANRPQASWPLLHILRLLNNTSLAGGNALAAVINRTRKYNGYLRRRLTDILSSIIDNDPKFQHSDGINDLKSALNFIRQRPHYEEFRTKIIRQITIISRNAKEIKIDSGTPQNHSLRVFSVKRLN